MQKTDAAEYRFCMNGFNVKEKTESRFMLSVADSYLPMPKILAKIMKKFSI